MATKRDGVLRFGVGSATGPRSSVWRLWTSPKRGDVYIAARVIGGQFKASLHQSGDWRVAFTTEHVASPASLVSASRSRVVTRWRRPTDLIPGLTQAFTIIVPASEVAAPRHGQPTLGEVWWGTLPADGHVTMFTILLAVPSVTVSGWPCRRSMGTRLVGLLPIDAGVTVWVVAHDRPEETGERVAWEGHRAQSRVLLAAIGEDADQTADFRAVGVGQGFFVDLLVLGNNTVRTAVA